MSLATIPRTTPLIHFFAGLGRQWCSLEATPTMARVDLCGVLVYESDPTDPGSVEEAMAEYLGHILTILMTWDLVLTNQARQDFTTEAIELSEEACRLLPGIVGTDPEALDALVQDYFKANHTY